MKQWKCFSSKEKLEYIGIMAIYPLILLYEQIGKSVKFLNSRSRQITASILTVCLMLTMIPVMSLTASATTADWSYPTSTPAEPFADGTGDESDPYIIATAQQLANMSYLVNNDNANYGEKHYKLSANIDLAGGDWTPVGNYENRFMGTFDGAYYTISNLTVQSDLGYCGLFGYVSGMINNVAITNANVNGSYYAGGVAGYLEGYASINNCSVSGSISGNTAGGISGYLVGTIYNCFNTATVTATAVSYSANAGGITGYLYAGDIMNSYNAGAVSSSVSGEYDYAYSCAGGIVGFARNDSYVQLINCYNIGAVTAENTAIGSDVKCLAGALAGDSPGSIFNSYWLTTSAATITGDDGSKYYCDSFENSTDTVSYNGAADEVSLLEALNAYVTGYSQSAENYGETAGIRIWAADTENTNNGYPVFKALHTHDNITFTPWFSTDILPTTSGNYYLVNDVTLAESYDVPENVSVNLCLNDRVINAADGYKSMEVSKNASLAIYDCGTTVRSYTENEVFYYWELDEIFDNNEKEKLTTGGVITGMLSNGALLNDGTLTINGGNIVGNGYNDYYSTLFNGENATLVINGGNIVGNFGGNGCPIIGNLGRATLNGGIIAHNNTNYTTTGVILNAGGTFTMNGGSVIENISERGVLNQGSFTMTDGEIAHNYIYPGSEGIGIHNWKGTVALSGGVIHDNTDTSENTNLINDTGELTDLLAEGYAFYDKDGNEIAPENLATAEYLEVKKAIPPHTHDFSTGECSCGAGILTFSSNSEFTLKNYSRSKYWDGTIEYSTDLVTWAEWDGSQISSASGKLYLRGKGNTYISQNSANRWVLTPTVTGEGVAASGSVMTLLDWETPSSAVMADFAFSNMFYKCTALTSAPELPATTLSKNCYDRMFYGCTALTAAPALPAKTLANTCYTNMFYGCTALTSAPELPATTLSTNCYDSMFYGCTSLTAAPALPAETLADSCYRYMFYDCTALEVAPRLPATTMTVECYNMMFRNCTSLKTAPELPATVLADSCYNCMFYGCTSLTKLPTLPATTLVKGCYSLMFKGCTGITLYENGSGETWSIPAEALESTESATNWNDDMFAKTGGSFTGEPVPGTTYYLSKPIHTHSWATEWTTNATHHWHECTADGCEVTVNSEKNGYAAHKTAVFVIVAAWL